VARFWSDGKFRDRKIQGYVTRWVYRECSGNILRLDYIEAKLEELNGLVRRNFPGLASPSRVPTALIKPLSGRHQSGIIYEASLNRNMMRDLVRALRQRESEMRGRLTPPNLVEWLEWMYSPGRRTLSHPLGAELFNTSEEVYYWVLDTILCHDFKERKDWYGWFLTLAELCKGDENYVSMCSIMRALNDVGGLGHTQRASSRDAEHSFRLLFEESLRYIRVAPKDLNTGKRLYPLDVLRDDLRYSFVAASRDPKGVVSWSACQQLCLKLDNIGPTLYIPPLDTSEVYLSLVSRIEEGLRERGSMAGRIQALEKVDAEQYTAWRRTESCSF